MTTQKFIQISVEGATYSIPLEPLDKSDPTPYVSLTPASRSRVPAESRLAIFANGEWFQVSLWPLRRNRNGSAIAKDNI